jgi:hypothetical protein
MDTESSTTDTGGIYLDIAQIEPGDILLTASKGLHAAVTRTFTQGEYSHAALVLVNVAILESDKEGVGHTLLPCDRAELPNALHGARLLHRLPSRITAATVLRKPGFAEFLANKKIDLLAFTQPFLWRNYAKLQALANTLHETPWLKDFAQHVLGIIDRARDKQPEPGLFCSELVSAIYADIIGESLIPGLTPEQFSPNTFLSLGWDVVSRAITVADRSAVEAPEFAQPMNLLLKVAFDRDLKPDLVSFQNAVRNLRSKQ